MARKEEYDDKQDREAIVIMVSRSARKILDVGTGDCCCMAQLLAKKGFRVTAIDRSRKNLKAARKEARREKVNSLIDFRCADATKLPFPDKSFNVIVAFNTMHHIRKRAEAIKEMRRVCANRGKIIIADLTPRGRRVSGHKKDDKFLDSLETTLNSYFPRVKRIKNKYTATFVARLGGAR